MNDKLWSSMIKYSLVLVSAVVITACGGGGGGEPSGGGNTTISPTADFSSKTDAEITKMTGTAFSLGDEASSFDENLNATSSSSPSIPKAGISSKLVPGVCSNQSNGGSVDVSAGASVSSGTFTFVNCDINSVTLDGQFILAASNIATFETRITLNTFSVTTGGTTKLTFSGTMHEFSSYANGIETGRVSSNGGKLNFTIVSPSFSDDIEISDFYESYTDDTNLGLESSDYSYIVNSTDFGGSLSIKTTQTIKHNNLDTYPYAGQFVVTGSNNSSVRVEILGDGSANGLVRVEIDKDGDGVYESSNDVLWPEFELKS